MSARRSRWFRFWSPRETRLYLVIPLRLGGSDVLVQGGQFFPEATKARLLGSTFGGSFLKMHWIGIGMHLEFDAGHEGGPIITTPVIGIRVERDRITKGTH